MVSRNYNFCIGVSEFSKFIKTVKFKNNQKLNEEFQALTVEAKYFEEKEGLSFNVGNSCQNRHKNRYDSILPFDQNLVIINDRTSPDDYINASYIPFDDLEHRNEFIASQGPLEYTVENFWTMIIQQNIGCVVMLTRISERNCSKCFKYWPEYIGSTTYYGANNAISVTLMKENERKCYFKRTFVVYTKELLEPKTIIQLHMHSWDDQCNPDIESLDQLLIEYHKLKSNMTNSLDLIHCSAGVGRTGTFMCIYRIIKQLLDGIETINIYETVLKLRAYRAFLVEKESLYIFIYDYINHFIETYTNVNNNNKGLPFNDKQDLFGDCFN